MRSLYSRVFLTTVAVILISSLLGFFAANFYYHVKLKPFNDDKLMNIATQIKHYLETDPVSLDDYMPHTAALGYQFYLTDGAAYTQQWGNPFRQSDLPSEAVEAVLRGEPYHGVRDFPNKPFLSGFFDNQLRNTVGLSISRDNHVYALFLRPDVNLQFGELRIFFALIIALTIAFSIMLFLISTRYIVQPITRLSMATKRIAQGHFNLDLPRGRRDEIGQLTSSFVTMGQELGRIEQSRQQFVSNVTHEIQSPLTSIQGFAKVLSEPDLSADDRMHYASIIEEESRRLSQLSKQLLLLSSLESGAEQLNRKPITLQEQIRQAAQVLQWQIEEKALLLQIAVPPTLVVHGDEVLLMQVWMNLLGNAVQYIPEGRSIRIVAEQRGTQVTIIVQDSGDGIAQEHLPHLFDRFYRVDEARDRNSAHAGLGLSIVRIIIQLHDGSIEVASSADGTCFTITLPLPFKTRQQL